MPYRAKEAIHTDTNPLAAPFNGRLLSESDPAGNFVLKGKGGIFTDAEAEKFGLAGRAFVEPIEDGQAQRESDECNRATYEQNRGDGGAFRIVRRASTPATQAPTEPQPNIKPAVTNPVSVTNAVEVSNPVAKPDARATKPGK